MLEITDFEYDTEAKNIFINHMEYLVEQGGVEKIKDVSPSDLKYLTGLLSKARSWPEEALEGDRVYMTRLAEYLIMQDEVTKKAFLEDIEEEMTNYYKRFIGDYIETMCMQMESAKNDPRRYDCDEDEAYDIERQEQMDSRTGTED